MIEIKKEKRQWQFTAIAFFILHCRDSSITNKLQNHHHLERHYRRYLELSLLLVSHCSD